LHYFSLEHKLEVEYNFGTSIERKFKSLVFSTVTALTLMSAGNEVNP